VSAPEKLYYWAPAPNRHLDPLLEALRSTGALLHEFYGETALRWTQLGTASVAPTAIRTILEDCSAPAVRRVLRDLDPTAMHLVHGLRDLSATVSLALGDGAARFIMCESPLPRPRLSPRRVVREAFYRRQLRSATGVFAVSRFAAAAVRALGVPFERIAPAAYPVPLWDRRNQGVRTNHRILFCGRAVLRKGLDLLTHALAAMWTGGARFTFEYAGDGPEASRALRFLEGHAIPVVHHGSVSSERVLELMAEASTVVVPSLLWEGWGYVVCEAIAAGAVVVASDIVGAAELVVPGLTGVIFRAGDQDALANALREGLNFARDPRAAGAMASIAEAAGPDRTAAYVVETMAAFRSRKALPEPPWHAVIRELGGNGSIDWWAHARQGRALPLAPFIPERLLRHI